MAGHISSEDFHEAGDQASAHHNRDSRGGGSNWHQRARLYRHLQDRRRRSAHAPGVYPAADAAQTLDRHTRRPCAGAGSARYCLDPPKGAGQYAAMCAQWDSRGAGQRCRTGVQVPASTPLKLSTWQIAALGEVSRRWAAMSGHATMRLSTVSCRRRLVWKKGPRVGEHDASTLVDRSRCAPRAGVHAGASTAVFLPEL